MSENAAKQNIRQFIEAVPSSEAVEPVLRLMLDELNAMQDGIDAGAGRLLETVFVDGVAGVGAVALTFTNADGSALTAPLSGTLYFSEEATGLAAAALDTGAAASKGVIAPVVSTSHYSFITNAAGELDMTLTSLADSYWVVFAQPNGSLLISDECAIT
jgi:hypothetical protein